MPEDNPFGYGNDPFGDPAKSRALAQVDDGDVDTWWGRFKQAYGKYMPQAQVKVDGGPQGGGGVAATADTSMALGFPTVKMGGQGTQQMRVGSRGPQPIDLLSGVRRGGG